MLDSEWAIEATANVNTKGEVMALKVPDWQIDPTDNRIREVVCYGCFYVFFAEKGSDCDIQNKCTRCLGSGKIVIVRGN